MNLFHQIKAVLRHWLLEVDDHSVHSPFFFDFYNNVLRAKSDEQDFEAIEKLRSDLLFNNSVVVVEDMGAGSSTLTSNKRTLGDIAKTSLTPKELAAFYFRIIRHFEAERVVELGSSLGVTTLYLAQRREAEVFTFEGSAALANISLTNYEYFEQKNIQLIEGNLDQTLSEFLQDPAKINFVLMDANHQYAPTMKYFSMIMRRLTENSVVVVDDIHWSPDMEKAWNELKVHPLVYGSVDLFRCGILFFEPTLNRQHFIWSL